MSLSTQTMKRLPQIKAGLLKGLTYGQIGDISGVTEKTIDRDMKTWVESGDFETWIKEEWVRLHAIVIKKKPVEAYRNLTNLLGKMVTRKIEKKIEVSEKVAIEITALLADYEATVERAVNRIIQKDDSAEQVDTAQTDA